MTTPVSLSSLTFSPSILRWTWVGLWLLLLPVMQAQQQFQGWCARVKIEIEQELTLERVGFEATLTVTNNDGEDPITDFFAALTFEDPELSTPEQTNDASDLFFVRQPTLQFINSVDGNGVIQPTRTAVVRWFIIPKIAAGGTDPRGKVYRVGCRLGGKLAGVEIPAENMLVIPADITVRPEPQLEITYFIPRDVQGNDPFTERVEAPVPFTLGVLVKNTGFGIARSLKINSQQPRIAENKQGLLLVAQLLGARVMDSPLNRASLLVDLGDIGPGETRKGAWDMITTLSGEFIEFRASYTHASDLGGEETSVITSLDTHFILREVLNDEPGRDTILDFLAVTDRNADMIPDALFESEGNILPVNRLNQVTVLDPLGADRTVRVGVLSDFEGWGYVRVDDPAQDKLAIERVVRSDGKVLHPRNVWTSYRYERPSNRKLDFLHIFDRVEPGIYYEYTVTYAPPLDDTTPPFTEINFAGEVTEVDGVFYVSRDTQVFFLTEDESPVGQFYAIDGGDFLPALPFSLGAPGTYVISYFAEDVAGNREETRTATVVVPAGPPGFVDPDRDPLFLALSGDTLSVRPKEAEFSFEVSPSPTPVEGTVDIFAGVVAWPVLTGVPPSPSPASTVSIDVGGAHVDYYRYRVNGGSWSAERPATEPVVIESVPSQVTLEVLARHSSGGYLPDSEALAVSWTRDGSAPAYTLSGLPSWPSDELEPIIFVDGPGVELYRWTLNGSFFRAEALPEIPIVLDPLTPGLQNLDLISRRGGVWPSINNFVRFRWLFDPTYGSDLSSLRRVRTLSVGEVQGRKTTVRWDGLDDAGVPQPAGWYTARITVRDDLGNVRHYTRLIELGNLTSGATFLAEASASGRLPSARGNWAVWQARPAGVWQIFAQNLTEPGSSAVALTSGGLARERPRTDGRYAVWQGRRTDGGWDIWAYDLTAGGSAVRLTNSADLLQTRPVTEYPWVVWQSQPASNSSAPIQLVAYHLETGESFPVHPGAGDQVEASIQAGRVVWRDQRDVGPGEIYFADLNTGERRRLTSTIFGQFHPAIYGPWAVWQDTTDGIVQINGFDFLRNTIVRLTDSPYNQGRPYLQGDWMIVEEDSSGPLSGNFRLYHLEAGRSLPLTNSATRKTSVGMAGGYLVWEEDEAGTTAVRVAGLPALQAVFRNRNAVVVTPALVSRYGQADALLEAWHAEAGVVSLTRYLALAPEPVAETVQLENGSPAGTDFPLVAGEFLWVSFSSEGLLDLGPRGAGPVDLAAGLNALGYAGFPSGYRVSDLLRDLGPQRVRALRLLDGPSGQWQSLEIREGEVTGPDVAIPEVSLLLLDLLEGIPQWTPTP